MDVTEIARIQEENPQSRFRVTAMPILAPGTCVLCKSPGGDQRAFIDFGFQLDWYGAVYFCTECITEAATLIGLGSKVEYSKHEADLNNSLSALDGHVWDLKEKLDAAMVLVRNCTCADSGIGIPVVELSEADVIDPESADTYESDADEYDPVEGSDDISADSGDDEPIVSPKRTRKSVG